MVQWQPEYPAGVAVCIVVVTIRIPTHGGGGGGALIVVQSEALMAATDSWSCATAATRALNDSPFTKTSPPLVPVRVAIAVPLWSVNWTVASVPPPAVTSRTAARVRASRQAMAMAARMMGVVFSEG